MIHTIVEFDDTFGKDYYFVDASITDCQLVLVSLNSYCKFFKKTIDLTQLSDLNHEQNDLETLYFSYEGEGFYFVDYGNDVVNYILHHLPAAQFH